MTEVMEKLGGVEGFKFEGWEFDVFGLKFAEFTAQVQFRLQGLCGFKLQGLGKPLKFSNLPTFVIQSFSHSPLGLP